MLINTKEIIANIESQVLESEPVDLILKYQNISQGYIKYGLYARKLYFFHAFYKAFHLESFKANIDNAATLAEILSHLLIHFLPNPKEWTIITTPKRAHFEKLGYHFSSEVLKITEKQTGINFLEDVVGSQDKNKINPVFFQLKPLPAHAKLLLFDDILTTGRTISTTLEILKSNPHNKLYTTNIPVIIGINNN